MTAGVYLLFYLYAIGDIDIGHRGWDWQSLPLTLERLLDQRAAFYFEALAKAEMGYLMVLLSPGNLLIAGLLAALLGLNVHGALSLRRQSHCRVGAGAGAGGSIGALPALLAGGACCAPSLLLLLGLPALGAFIGLFAWLVPASLLLLAVGRWWQRREGARPVLGVL